MTHAIQNIIFDFGGVLLNIDYQKTYDELGHLLGYRGLPTEMTDEFRDILIRFEKGEMGTESFIWALQRTSKKEIPHGDAIIRAWNAMLIGWFPGTFKLLEELGQKYNIFLLSNTNALHIGWVHHDLKITHTLHGFEQRFFKKVYYSHEIGLRKPDIDIYRFVTEDAKLLPEETIFIDDLAENIMGAKKTGWNVYQHNPNENLEEILRSTLKLL